MKIEKLTDIVNNPEHPIMQEVNNSFSTNPGDKVICVKCQKEYERGVWNFYNLCDDCFREHDRMRMERRLEEMRKWMEEQNGKKDNL